MTMKTAGWFKNFDMQKVIDGMKSLREVKIASSRKKVITTPTALQEKIMRLFGVVV